jgi:hypothetical protein
MTGRTREKQRRERGDMDLYFIAHHICSGTFAVFVLHSLSKIMYTSPAKLSPHELRRRFCMPPPKCPVNDRGSCKGSYNELRTSRMTVISSLVTSVCWCNCVVLG